MSSDLEKTPQRQEQDLAQAYLNTAELGREVANLALQQALRDAKAGNLRDPAKTATSAITASAIALDKRLILQERPTQIVAHNDPKADGLALMRQLGITIDTTATDLNPPAETRQLEAPATKQNASPARGRARKTAQARDIEGA